MNIDHLNDWLEEIWAICEQEHWCYRPEDWMPFFEDGLTPSEAVSCFIGRAVTLHRRPNEQYFPA